MNYLVAEALNIGDFPIEITLIILSFLDLEELMKCKLVCKQWKHFVDQIRIKDLVVIGEPNCEFTTFVSRFYTYEPICYQSLFKPSNREVVQSALSNMIFMQLKYLNINIPIDSSWFDLEVLNDLRLEQLDVYSIFIQNRIRLKMNSLSVLCIENISSLDESSSNGIELDSANLSALRCDYGLGEFLHIYHPSSVKHLVVKACKCELTSFTNLEFYQEEISKDLSANILSILPRNLKELNLLNDVYTNFHYDKQKPILENLMRTKSSLKRSDLQIFYEGIKLTTESDLPHMGYRLAYTYACNFESLTNTLPYFNDIDYHNVSCAFLQIPTDFHQRFNNIQQVYASGEFNQAQFARFLLNCRNLVCLTMIGITNFNQQFFDQLPAITSLMKLIVERNAFEIDFGFLCKFKKLFALHVDQRISRPFVESLFENQKYLKMIGLVIVTNESTCLVCYEKDAEKRLSVTETYKETRFTEM